MILIVLAGQLLAATTSGSTVVTNIPPLGSIAVKTEPAYDGKYDPWINYYCEMYAMDPELVKIVIDKESQFNPSAVSRSGAIGLMQLMPETAEILGVKDPYDPSQNIEGGVRFLRNMFDMFGGNLELALAAYHAGPGTVSRLNRVPSIPETIEYVDYILSRYGGAPKKEMYFTLTDEGTPLLTNRAK
jgi:soluble lytic murein transglycosylase-like protein